MLLLLNKSAAQPAPPGLVGDYWYVNQAPGILINNRPATTGPNSIPLYPDFNVTIQDQNVPVHRLHMAIDGTGYQNNMGVINQQPFGACDIDVNGAVTATVVVSNRTVNSHAVYPSRYGVVATRQGSTITVPLPHPGKYVLQINGSEDNPLIFTVNPPEAPPPTGNVIIFPPGVHMMGRVPLASNTTAWIQRGAVVYGSFSSFGSNSVLRGRGFLSKLLEADTGGATAAHFLQVSGGNNVKIEGIYLIYGQPFQIRPTSMNGLLIDNIKQFTARRNSDGCSVTSSQNVTLQNSLMAGWDDPATVKTDPGGPVDNFNILGCLFMSRSGWRLFLYGAEGGAEYRNSLIKRNDCLWTHTMNVCHTETPNNPFIHHITVDDLNIEQHHGHQRFGLDPTTRLFHLGNDGGGARHEDMTFKNIRGTGILPPSDLNGNCNRIRFENIFWNGSKISTSDAAMHLSRNGGPINNVVYA